MPASLTETLRMDFDAATSTRLVEAALLDIGATITDRSSVSVAAKTGWNLRCFWETVKVTLEPSAPSGTTLTVSSRCVLPTQFLDWGKNSANIRAFKAALDRRADRPV